ncbi:MAG: response regulator, partial [Treponema sp.]|nr:response regulator [Treponema sp.]
MSLGGLKGMRTDKMNEKEKILLIDDDETQFLIVQNMLNDEYEIITAKSGKEAIEYLYGGLVPNLILLDILMPNMDGWEVFNRIRAISLLKNVPIVFLTSLSGKDEKKRGYEIGAAGYIMKPYNKPELMDRIKTAIDNVKKN